MKILTSFVDSPKWYIRAEAVREMGKVFAESGPGSEKIVERLAFVAKNDAEPKVRWNAVNALGRIATNSLNRMCSCHFFSVG